MDAQDRNFFKIEWCCSHCGAYLPIVYAGGERRLVHLKKKVFSKDDYQCPDAGKTFVAPSAPMFHLTEAQGAVYPFQQ